MADTLKSVFKISTGTTELIPLVVGTSSTTSFTILSILLCNRDTSAHTFNLYISDMAPNHIGNDAPLYLYQTQPLPALATFIHNDKLIMMNEERLVLTTSGGTNVNIHISYLEHTA
jgi:hypothetical protein